MEGEESVSVAYEEALLDGRSGTFTGYQITMKTDTTCIMGQIVGNYASNISSKLLRESGHSVRAKPDDDAGVETNNTRAEKRWICKPHPNFTVLIVFLAVMIDCMLMTVVEMILDMDLHPNKLISDRFLTLPTHQNNHTIKEDLARKYSLKVSLLVSLKPGLEMFFNVAVGVLVDRIGYRLPMLIGCLFNLSATLSFAYLRNYYLLIVARSFQAAGSSLSVIGGLTFLAATFKDEKSRTIASSKAFCGISVGVSGVSGGFAMGSILYQMFGRESPFLVLGLINIIYSTLVILLVVPRKYTKPGQGSLKSLLLDKFIVITLLINFVENFTLGVFLGTGPSWMLYTLHGQQWNIGVILAVASVINVGVQWLTGRYTRPSRHWLFLFLGIAILAIGSLLYPFATIVWEVLVPECISRIGHGMLVACANPMLTHLVDIRHNSHYGLVNGLYTATYNLGQFFLLTDIRTRSVNGWIVKQSR
ncbi:synaptic vesicular amine transporter-like [Watersipora subatra]|uniref:synaptic vesicular amine transporter-like n=1 Tax=Watersipora subatra TaxID=2589382 RepID=UPI00355C97F1